MSPGCARSQSATPRLFEALPAQLTAQTRATINQTMAQGMRQTAAIIETTMQQVSAERQATIEQAMGGITQERQGHSSSSWRG